MPLVAQVAVSGATIHFDKLYSYLVPQSLAQRVHTGSMVLVPFGRGSKARMGVVLAAGEEPAGAKLKELYDAAPEEAELIVPFEVAIDDIPRFLSENTIPLSTRAQLILDGFARHRDRNA